MKRDMDLVRRILLEMEKHEHGFAPRHMNIEGYSDDQIGHHVYLMAEAGLINAADSTHFGSHSPVAIPKSITWDGHEFLEAARKSTVWETAKKKISDAGVGWTFEILKHVLIETSKHTLGLSTA